MGGIGEEGRACSRERRYATVGASVVFVAVLLVVAGSDVYGPDTIYLASLDALAAGFEAPRPWRHLSWAPLHLLGALRGDAADGVIGRSISWTPALLVPWAAFVAWRVSRGLGLAPRAAALCAVLAAAAPSTLVNVGTVDTLPRWLGAGLGLLGVVRGLEAVRTGRPRDFLGATALMGLGIAWHPSAVALPLVGLPLWPAHAGETSLRARLLRTSLLAAAGLGLAGLWIAGSGQGVIAAVGVGTIPDALRVQPVVAAAQSAWQWPLLGRAFPMLPTAVGAGAAGVLAIALIASGVTRRRPGRRAAGLLLLGSFAALLPEAAAVGFIPEPSLAWTLGATRGGFVPALAGLVAAVAVVEAVLTARSRRVRGVVLAVVGVVVVARAVPLVLERSAVEAAEGGAQRQLAVDLLVPAVQVGGPRWIAGDPRPLSRAVKEAKWLPERPARMRRLDPRKFSFKARAVHRTRAVPPGLDTGMWLSAVTRCTLWFGLPPGTPGACAVAPTVGPAPPLGTPGCGLDVRSRPPAGSCSERPPPASPAATLDGRAIPWTLLSLLSLAAAVTAGSSPSPLVVAYNDCYTPHNNRYMESA